MQKLGLSLNFYGNFIIASIIVDLCCITLLFTQGIGAFFPVFWFKIMTLGLIVLFVNHYKKREFHFYKNLGLNKYQLWGSSLGMDFLLFLCITAASLAIR